jgi:hypothetical protein
VKFTLSPPFGACTPDKKESDDQMQMLQISLILASIYPPPLPQTKRRFFFMRPVHQYWTFAP